MNKATQEAIAMANAYLNNVGLPPVQERVVLVQVKNVYGNTMVYPANQAGEFFAAIAGTKTLSSTVLAYARRLGFDIQQVDAYSIPGVQ